MAKCRHPKCEELAVPNGRVGISTFCNDHWITRKHGHLRAELLKRGQDGFWCNVKFFCRCGFSTSDHNEDIASCGNEIYRHYLENVLDYA